MRGFTVVPLSRKFLLLATTALVGGWVALMPVSALADGGDGGAWREGRNWVYR
jgi:hypothetical protein